MIASAGVLKGIARIARRLHNRKLLDPARDRWEEMEKHLPRKGVANLETYYDVAVWKHNRAIFNCEKFSIDEHTQRLEFRNVTRQQNLWAFPIDGNILVWISVSNPQDGRFHVHGIVPGESDPGNRDPNYGHGSFNDTERFGTAA